MKIKRLAFILAVVLTAAALSACGNSTVIKIQNEKLTFLKTEVETEYEGITPAEGNQILTVRFLAENENPDLTVITDGLFGSNPSMLTTGANTYSCKSVAFENDNGRIIAVAVFEVPATPKGSAAYTLSGDAFGSIQFVV